jgi:cytochrome c-type biogenesis protein CcmH/NrfG
MITILVVALVATIAFQAWYTMPRVRDKLGFRNYFGAVLLIAWVAVLSIGSYRFVVRDEPPTSELMAAVQTLGPIDWDGDPTVSAAAQPTKTPSATGISAAPVASLIGGLEQRLEQNPGDANGWALLAQSYAFVGQRDRAEAAVAQAIALGFDEASLRSRVSESAREVRGGSWIEQTLAH